MERTHQNKKTNKIPSIQQEEYHTPCIIDMQGCEGGPPNWIFILVRPMEFEV